MPAMLYQGDVSADKLWLELRYAFSPSDFFVRFVDQSVPAEITSNGFVVLLCCSFLLAAYVIRACLFARSNVGHGETREFNFWLWASVAIFFLVTPLSAFLWDLLPIFKKVQYAWRLHAVLCVAALPLCAYAVEAYRHLEGARRRNVATSFALVAVSTLSFDLAVLGNPELFDSTRANASVARSSGMMALTLPRGVAPLLSPPGDVDNSLRPLRDRPTTWLTRGQATVSVIRWAPREISLQVHASSVARLVVRQFYFPGWVALKDGACCLDITAAAASALVQVDLPMGSHRVDLILTKRPIERAGEMISGITFSLLVLLLAFGVWIRCRERGRSAP